jgi:hypothetical protein
MFAVLAGLILHAASPLLASLESSLTVPSARIEVLDWRPPPSCRGRLETPPVSASGRVAVRVRGAGCDQWGWATVKVLGPAAVLTRPVKSGDSLEGAWRQAEVELRPGRHAIQSIAPGSTATRAMQAGQVLWAESVRSGPSPGTRILVRVVSGGVVIEEMGVVAGCTGELTCATLPSGRRIAGRFEDGALLVAAGSTGGRP